MACERKLMESEATTGFCVLLGKRGRICDCKSEKGRLVATNGVIVARRKIIPTTLFRVLESYDSDEGYVHLRVNQSDFVDRDTGAHTNSIEGTRSAIKNGLHKAHVKGQFDSYLAEYMWRCTKGHKMVDENFHDYLACILRVYPTLEKDDPQEGRYVRVIEYNPPKKQGKLSVDKDAEALNDRNDADEHRYRRKENTAPEMRLCYFEK
ncbi:DDE_Tnp_IS1595 domain-containing protein [Trichonephila clavipes]|nr:DDE_Tnp_IS1595 domain-containing protein [Trichonephila clavipes]